MTFLEWLKVYSSDIYDDHQQGIKAVSYDAVSDMEEAWDMAKADAEKDLAGWTAAAYEDGGLDMEARYEKEITKYRMALEEIFNLVDDLSSNMSDMSDAMVLTRIWRIARQALKPSAWLHGDPNETDKDNWGRGE